MREEVIAPARSTTPWKMCRRRRSPPHRDSSDRPSTIQRADRTGTRGLLARNNKAQIEFEPLDAHRRRNDLAGQRLDLSELAGPHEDVVDALDSGEPIEAVALGANDISSPRALPRHLRGGP